MAAGYAPTVHDTLRRALVAVTTFVGAAVAVVALGERNARRAEDAGAVRLTLDAPALKYELAPDPARAPPVSGDAQLQVAALGDSVTHGAFVPGEQAWPARLGQALTAGGRPARVRSWAAFGYDAESVAASYVARARAELPDVVVYGYYVNDAMPTELISSGERPLWVGTGPRPFVVIARALDPALHTTSALFRRAEGTVAARALDARGTAPPLDWRAFHRAIDTLVAATRADCAALVAVAIPPWPLAYASDADCVAAAGVGKDFCVVSSDALLRGTEALRARGVTVVDGREAYREGDPAALRGQANDPHHPAAEGHARLARALVGAVRAAEEERRCVGSHGAGGFPPPATPPGSPGAPPPGAGATPPG